MKYKERYKEYLLSRIELLKGVAGNNDMDIGTVEIMVSVFFDSDYFGTDVDSICNDVNKECEKHGVHKVMLYDAFIGICREGELDKLI
jgi:hypothetical protein